jgi:hypothetical protein
MLNRSDKFKYKIAKYREDMPTPKRGEIVIVPQDNRLIEIPPYVANGKLPSWWKNLPKDKGTLRSCEGTYDLVSFGIVIPAWSNVTIRPNITGTNFEARIDPMNQFPDGNFLINGFSAASASGCPMENLKKLPESQYIKLVSPWRYRTPKGVSLIALPLLHEPNPNYEIVPGMIHTDFYNQIHIVLNIKTDKEFTIPAGTPLQHLIPVRRNDNTKRIVWGNESMYKYVQNSGLGDSSIPSTNTRVYYRKKQRDNDAEMLEKESKRWNFLKK